MTVVCPFVPQGLNTSSVEAPCLFSCLGTISVTWLLGEEPQAQAVCEQEATGLDIRKTKSATWREISPPATISKGSNGLSSAPSFPTGPPGKYGGWGVSLLQGPGLVQNESFPSAAPPLPGHPVALIGEGSGGCVASLQLWGCLRFPPCAHLLSSFLQMWLGSSTKCRMISHVTSGAFPLLIKLSLRRKPFPPRKEEDDSPGSCPILDWERQCCTDPTDILTCCTGSLGQVSMPGDLQCCWCLGRCQPSCLFSACCHLPCQERA